MIEPRTSTYMVTRSPSITFASSAASSACTSDQDRGDPRLRGAAQSAAAQPARADPVGGRAPAAVTQGSRSRPRAPGAAQLGSARLGSTPGRSASEVARRSCRRLVRGRLHQLHQLHERHSCTSGTSCTAAPAARAARAAPAARAARAASAAQRRRGTTDRVSSRHQECGDAHARHRVGGPFQVRGVGCARRGASEVCGVLRLAEEPA